jgi:hypothetical protein
MKELKSKPINDFIIRNGHIQDDGSLVHDMYLYEVKKPSESKGPWDLYKLIATIPGAEAYKRPRGNECPRSRVEPRRRQKIPSPGLAGVQRERLYRERRAPKTKGRAKPSQGGEGTFV